MITQQNDQKVADQRRARDDVVIDCGAGQKRTDMQLQPCAISQSVYMDPSFAKFLNRADSRGGAAKEYRPAFEMRLDINRRPHATV